VCGRATLSSPAEDIAEIFDVSPIDIGPPKYNLAPTQPIVTVRNQRVRGGPTVHDHQQPTRQMALVRWGLIPWWAKVDEAKKIGARCIQARAETARKGPAFRDAFKKKRCLVVVDGFYEWKTLPDGRRIPHLVRYAGEKSPFAIAGLWSSWRPDTEEEEEEKPSSAEPDRIESAAVLTTRSAGPIRDLHTRMPLVLFREDWETWLSGSDDDAALLLKPDEETLVARAKELLVIPVSTWVNDVKHDDPKCLEPTPIEPIRFSEEVTHTPEKQLGFDFGELKEAAGMKKGRRK